MSTPPVLPNLEEITAPLLLGDLWNWTLYGVLVVQLYVYSYNFPGDRSLIKLLVYSVFLLETVQTALTGADLYYWFVTGFGNPAHLASPSLSPVDVPIIGSIVSFTVQLFFVYRIWVLGGRSSWPLCLLICLCSTVDAVAAFYGGVNTQILKRFATGRALKIPALIWLGGNTLSDILITGSMLYHLGRRRRDANGHFSDRALSRIVRLTVETNLLTTTVGIVSFLMIAVFPDKDWFICPTAIIGKLYSNTLLVSLNNRISIREGRGPVTRSPAATSALTTGTDSRPTMEIVELKKPSGTGLLEDSARQDTSRIFDIA
jgi:hypothetical protein